MKISMLRPTTFQAKAGVFARALCVGAFAVGFLGTAQAQVSGTKNIPGDYVDLAAAITDVNTVGVAAGGATLNLLAGNAQTAPAGGYSVTTLTTSAANPLTITGNSNTVTANAALTAGNLNDAIFKIIGSDNVTLSGFTMSENAANTTTAAGTNNMTEFGVALLYANATDNSQNITIRNNVIALNRAYQNTFGVYANATHTALAVTTTASATGAAGGNSGLKIYSNTISNVNNGISVVGPIGAADANDGVDIGGASAATANTLSNFGTTNLFSGYANVSASVNGVLIRNSKNFNVSFNSIASSTATIIPTATNSGTLRAVFVPAASVVPLGTIANSINSNVIALRAGAAATTLQGIIVEAINGNATTTSNINGNNFTDVSFNINGTTAVSLISTLAVVLNSNINNNTFTNLTTNTSLGVTFITHSFTLPAGGSRSEEQTSL